MSNDKRQPAGIPTGGQFAASAKAEADVSLSGTALPGVGSCNVCTAPAPYNVIDEQGNPTGQKMCSQHWREHHSEKAGPAEDEIHPYVSAPANPSVANIDVEGHDEAVAPCSDCGAPIAGAIPGAANSAGGPVLMPGASCPECPHIAASPEVTSEPDDEGAVYVYTMAHDGSITVHDEDGDDIETWDLGTTGWHDNAAILDVAGQEDQVRVAVLAVEEPERLVAETCARMGVPHLSGVFDIVAQRGAVHSGTLLAQTSPEHVAILNSAHVEPRIEALGAEYAGLNGRTDLHPTSRQSYLDACDEAMLPAMKGIYDELDRRNLLTNGSARLINAEDVERDYFTYIGPAVDHVEDALLEAQG